MGDVRRTQAGPGFVPLVLVGIRGHVPRGRRLGGFGDRALTTYSSSVSSSTQSHVTVLSGGTSLLSVKIGGPDGFTE